MTKIIKNIIYILCLTLLCWNCSENEVAENPSKKEIRTTKPPFEIDSSKIEIVHEKHDNGNAKFYGTSYNDSYHGYCKTFFLNETISSQGNYHFNQKDDWWEYFHENGKLKECGHYSLGKLTGTWKYFDFNGTMTSEKNYLDGKLNGWNKTYVKGILVEEYEYQLDKKHGYYHFYENGILILKGNYNNDSKSGVWKTFNDQGKIVHEKVYG